MNRGVKRGVLIGCGFFSRNHMAGWAEIAGVEIVAVCDLDRQKAEAMAADFGISGVYTDAGTMLTETNADFVDIATTVVSHRPLVELACRHTTAVICQKPFADTMTDARAMVSAAADAGALLFVHENFRWQLGFLKMAELIAEGKIGQPHFARFSFRHGYDNYKNQPYLLTTERFAVMDVGLHLLDLARHFMGEVDRLSCHTQRYYPLLKGEDAFSALLRHQSGAVTVLDCSFYSKINPEPFPQTVAWIEGDNGTLEHKADYSLTLHGGRQSQTFNVEPQVPSWGERPWHGVQDSVVSFERHVIDVLNGNATPQPSGEDNLKTLALALAAYDSDETGQMIAMNTWASAKK